MPDRALISDFSGGLLQKSNPLIFPLGVATSLNNVNSHSAPILSVRRGRTAFSAEPTDEAVYLGQYRTSAGRYILFRGLGSTGNVEYWDGTTWQTLGAMTARSVIYSAMFPGDDLIIFGDGTLMKKYDGTTFADLGGTPPILTCLEVYHARLWGVREQNKIVHSAADAPEDWSTANDYGYFWLDNAAGNAVTALRVFRGKLYAWTQGGFYAILGEGPWNYAPYEIHPTAGSYGQYAICDASGYLYWVGPDGIWEYWPNTAPKLISDGQIDTYISGVDPNEVSSISAGSDGIQARFSLPGVTTDREVLFDPRYRSWFNNDSENYHRYLLWRRP